MAYGRSRYSGWFDPTEGFRKGRKYEDYGIRFNPFQYKGKSGPAWKLKPFKPLYAMHDKYYGRGKGWDVPMPGIVKKYQGSGGGYPVTQARLDAARAYGKKKRKAESAQGPSSKRSKGFPQSKVVGMPHSTSNRNYSKSYKKRKTKRKVRRSKRKRKRKPSNALVKYVKNQIEKPAWSTAARERDFNTATLTSSINKVAYLQSNCLTSANIVSYLDGDHNLSFKTSSNAITPTAVGIDLYDASGVTLFHKQIKIREDFRVKMKNVSNATVKIKMILCEAKRPTSIVAHDAAQDEYESKHSTSAEMVDDPWVCASNYFKQKENPWKLVSVSTATVGSGQESAMAYHTKWATFNFDKIRLAGDGGETYQKGSFCMFWRLLGDLTHDATTETNRGYCPTSLLIEFDQVRFASYLDDDKAMIGLTNTSAPSFAASVAVVAEEFAAHRENHDT